MTEQSTPAVDRPAWTVENFARVWSGRDDYTRCIAAIVEALPDMYMEVARDRRTRAPFELTGIDRVRLHGSQVAENVIVFDTAAFEARSGRSIPWA